MSQHAPYSHFLRSPRFLTEASSVDKITPEILIGMNSEKYARVLHPATLTSNDGKTSNVRWSQVAETNGTTIHPAAAWPLVAGNHRPGGQPGLWNGEPQTGYLDPVTASAIHDVLTRLFPEGRPAWGGVQTSIRLEPRQALLQADAFHAYGLPFQLLQGTPAELLAATGDLTAPAELIWSLDDNYGLVSLDDQTSTYIGGSKELIAALLSHPDLEAFEVPPHHDISFAADTINPRPPEAEHWQWWLYGMPSQN